MADNDFGLRIGIDGERDFKRALADINQSFKLLGSEMTLVTSQFEKNDNSAKSLTARNEVLNKEIDTQKGKIETLRSALDNAAASFGESDKRTQNWQIQLNKAEAELNNMGRELGENEKALNDVGKEEDETAKSADKLGDELKDTGGEADDSGGKFEKLGGILKGVGAAMGAAFAAVGAAAVAATKSLAEMSVGTAAYADEILTQATVTGMSTEALQAYSYAADLVDVSMDTLTGSMAKQIKSMDAARNGNKNMVEAYEALGVSVVGADGNLRDSEAVYWEAIDALGRMEEGAQRDALAMRIFGKSAQDLNPLIAAGSAGIAELTEEAKRMGAVLSDEQLEQAGAFDDVIQRLTQGSEAAKRALGMVLMPQLTELGTAGVELIGNFTRGLNEANGDWSKISEVIGETVGGIAGLILEQLPQIIDTAMSIVSAVGGAIIDNLPTLVDTASQIVMSLTQGLISALPALTEGALQLVLALVDGIISNLPSLVEAAVQMISTLAQGLAGAIPALVPAIVDVITQIAAVLIDNLPLLLDAALALVEGLAQGILDAIPVLIEKLPELISRITAFLTESVPLIIETGIKLFVALVEALPDIIRQIVAVIPEIIDNIVSAVIDLLPVIIEAGVELFVALVEALPEIIEAVVAALPLIINAVIQALTRLAPKIIEAGLKLFTSLVHSLPQIVSTIVQAVPKIINGLITAFNSYMNTMTNIGGNLIKGLWNGIADAGAWLWEKISGFFGNVVARIKDFFGIHSPSALFAGLGADMGEGVGVGFGQVMAHVSRDMQNAIPTSFDLPGFNGGALNAAGIRGAAGAGGAPAITINNTFNGVTAESVPHLADRANNALLRRLAAV